MKQIDNILGIRKLFEYYKSLGDKTLSRVTDEQLFWQPNSESNSLATLVYHLHGNMLSRWTDFLTSDGEKEWRDRDSEFENNHHSKEELLNKWEEGWMCLFSAISTLREEDLDKVVYIRNQGQTVMEAVHRQLAHYSYHVGQMVFLGKMLVGKEWESLSIPKGNSKNYNVEKFSKPLNQDHFTGESLPENINKAENQ